MAGAARMATATRRCTARATIRSFTIRSCATIRSSLGPTATDFTATDSTGIGIGRSTAVGTRSPTVRATCSSTAYARAVAYAVDEQVARTERHGRADVL